MSTANAKERALTAEERYLRSRLRNANCVDGWSLTSFVGLEQSATVTNRTAEGVTVEVSHPYSYRSSDVDADVESEARYLVTENETRRVDGPDVAPCSDTTAAALTGADDTGQFRANNR
jgi:hypothetical protein